MNTLLAAQPLSYDLVFEGWAGWVAATLAFVAIAVVVTLYVMEGIRAKTHPLGMLAAIPIFAVLAAAVVYRFMMATERGPMKEPYPTSWFDPEALGVLKYHVTESLFLLAEVLLGGALAVLLSVFNRYERPRPPVLIAAAVIGLAALVGVVVESNNLIQSGQGKYVGAPWGIAGVVAILTLVSRLGLHPAVLAAVRTTAVAAIALLLMRPVWVLERHEDRPRPVVVLLDVSWSMDTDDPRPAAEDQWRAALAFGHLDPESGLPTGAPSAADRGKWPDKPTRLQVARAALTNPRLDLFNRLQTRGPVELYSFGRARAARSTTDLAWLDAVAVGQGSNTHRRLASQILEADRGSTALLDAALDLLQRGPNDLPAAVVIVTDGLENASTKANWEGVRKAYRERGVPLHVYGVGSSAFGQLRVLDAPIPEGLFIDKKVRIPVNYSATGMPGAKVDIKVYYGDNPTPVASKTVTVPRRKPGDDPTRDPGANLSETELSFTPGAAEAENKKQEIRVEVTATIGTGPTAQTLKDTVTRPTQIVTKKMRVLVIDGLPRKDFMFLQRSLMRDQKGIEAMFFLTEGDYDAMITGYPWAKEFASRSGVLPLDAVKFREYLSEFHLLILGDVSAKFFKPEHHQVIEDFVKDGGGLIHFAGRWNAPAGWADAPAGQPSIANVLPVEVKAVKFPLAPPTGRYNPPFVPVVTPNATYDQLIRLEDNIDDNRALWGKVPGKEDDDPPPASKVKQLPALEWYYPVVRLKKGAEVFLVHPTDKLPPPDKKTDDLDAEAKPMPLLAGHFYGKGYVLFCAFDDTWRWRFNEADKYFAGFWSQAADRSGLPAMIGTRLTRVELAKRNPTTVKGAQMYGRILDENFQPLKVSEVPADLVYLDAVTPEPPVRVYLRKLDDEDGNYTGVFTKQKDERLLAYSYDRPGRYKLTVTPPNKSPSELEFTISLPPKHELARDGMAKAELVRLAEGTNRDDDPNLTPNTGKFYHEEDLHQMPGNIEPKTAPYTPPPDKRLLLNWWALCMIVGLLSLEWFLRKFNGLS